MKYRYFKIKNEIITPIGKNDYYWFDVSFLKETPTEDGRKCFIFDFAKKDWVTNEMILELIKIARELYPNIDHTPTLESIAKHREFIADWSAKYGHIFEKSVIRY